MPRATGYSEQARARRSTPTSVIPAEVILIRVGTFPRSSSLTRTDSPLVSMLERSGSSKASGRSAAAICTYTCFSALPSWTFHRYVSPSRGAGISVGPPMISGTPGMGHIVADRHAPSQGPLASVRGPRLDNWRAPTLPFPAVSDDALTRTRLDRTRPPRSFQTLRRELGINGFGMNLITLAAGQRGRIHTHDVQEEVFLVLEGELTLLVEGEPHALAVDELARVGPGVKRQLANAGAGRLVLLALGGSGEHVGRDGRAWSAWEQTGPGAPPQEVPLPDDLPPS